MSIWHADLCAGLDANLCSLTRHYVHLVICQNPALKTVV